MTPSQRRQQRRDIVAAAERHARLTIGTLCRCGHALGEHQHPSVAPGSSPCLAVAVEPRAYLVNGFIRQAAGVMCTCEKFEPAKEGAVAM